jgi:hypothetical protein
MRRHDFDPIAFVFGVVFAGLGVVFMTGQLELLNHAQWLWPGLLVLLGLAVLVGARMRGGTREQRPAFDSGPSIDPAVEDELLHGTIRNIESEHLLDTSTLFTLRHGTKAEERAAVARPGAEAPAEAETLAGAEPEAAARPEAETLVEAEAPAEVEPEASPPVDRDADTELLPPRGRKDAGPEED